MSSYVEPRRAKPYGPILTVAPPPDPKKEQDVNPTVNQIPRDQIVLAATAINDYLVANPRLGLPDGLIPYGTKHLGVGGMFDALDAVCAYLIGEWCPKVCALGPFPGDAEGWRQRREAGLHHVFATIERERGGQQPPPPPPPGELRGPISVSGRDFEVPQS